mmetsp:Transcript_20940/g.49958  ORF Transcript_20940/g.49958 Transcript_20940/m.49958 type:complete len:289 (+) Transcript_20940:863-1729(+)
MHVGRSVGFSRSPQPSAGSCVDQSPTVAKLLQKPHDVLLHLARLEALLEEVRLLTREDTLDGLHDARMRRRHAEGCLVLSSSHGFLRGEAEHLDSDLASLPRAAVHFAKGPAANEGPDREADQLERQVEVAVRERRAFVPPHRVVRAARGRCAAARWGGPARLPPPPRRDPGRRRAAGAAIGTRLHSAAPARCGGGRPRHDGEVEAPLHVGAEAPVPGCHVRGRSVHAHLRPGGVVLARDPARDADGLARGELVRGRGPQLKLNALPVRHGNKVPGDRLAGGRERSQL